MAPTMRVGLFCQYWCLDQTNVYVLVRIERWYRSWCKRTKNGFVVKLTPAQLSPLVTFRLSNGCCFKYFHWILQKSISYKQVELSTQLFPYGCKKLYVKHYTCKSLILPGFYFFQQAGLWQESWEPTCFFHSSFFCKHLHLPRFPCVFLALLLITCIAFTFGFLLSWS